MESYGGGRSDILQEDGAKQAKVEGDPQRTKHWGGFIPSWTVTKKDLSVGLSGTADLRAAPPENT